MSLASIIGVKPVREVSDQEYSEYYKKYEACLHKCSQNWVGKLGKEEAVHIAGIALWRAMQSYDASRKTNFLTYLTKCLRWTFLDVYKKERKQKAAHDIADYDAVFYPEEYDDRPEVLMRRLSEKNRQVIEMVRRGNNVIDIVREIGLSKQRIHQIFGQVRELRLKLMSKGKF